MSARIRTGAWLVAAALGVSGCSANQETGTGGKGSSTGTGTGGSVTGGSGTGTSGGAGGATSGGTGGGSTGTTTTGTGGATTGTTTTGTGGATAGTTTTGSGGSTGGTGGSGTGGSGTAGSAGSGGIVDAGAPKDAGGPLPDASGSSGCGAATWPASGSFTIDVAGTPREYVLKVPAGYDTNRPYRLIFAWHGATGTADQVASGRGPYGGYFGLDALAGGTAIFVAGQGLAPDGGSTGWPNTGGQDINFTRALVDWVKKNYCVDNARIFSVGFSYGGLMSENLGCRMADVFRAIAPMSGIRQGGTCMGQVAVWMSHGTGDPMAPIDGGRRDFDFWRNANHCGATTTPADPSPCVSYQGCDPGMPVTWCEFDGGHVIQNFAPQGIWNFFSAL